MDKNKLNSLSGSTIFYGFFSISQNILSFLFLPILTKYLTMGDFGVYSILLMITAISSALFYFGASSALGRFYFEYRDDKVINTFFSTAFFISLIGVVCLIVLAFCLSDIISILIFNSVIYSQAIFLSLISSSVTILLNLMTLIIRYNDQIKLFSITMVLGLILNTLITYILIRFYNYGILSPLIGTLFSSFVSFLFLFLIHRNLFVFKLDWIIFKKFLTFGLPVAFSSILIYVLDYSDKYIIKEVLDLKNLAVYSLAYKIGSTINVFLVIPFSLMWAPFRMRDINDPNYSNLTGSIIYYYLLIGITIIVLSMLFGSDILKLFFNKNYDDISNVFPIIMFAYLIYGLQNIVDIGIHLSKKTYLYFIVFLPAIILNCALNYFLIPLYGYVAAAYVTLITYVFTTSLVILFSSFYFSFSVQKLKVAFILIFLIILFGLTRFEYFEGILSKFYLFVIYITIVLLFFLNHDEKTMISKKISHFKNKLFLWIS
jgi:O-antigen/teichoic acid export membrane protein